VTVLEPGTPWRNWGRSESSRPEFRARAASVADVQDAVRAAAERGLPIKTVGAGHSFTSIAATDGVQLDISALEGVLGVDGDLVTFAAGTNLHQLPALLAPYGLALANMGDIDRQTLAGATSTGTHGTGFRFGGLATQIVALSLVTAGGGILRVSETENPHLLPAARLGLGALGVLVDLTIRCVPAFLLHAVERPEPLDEVLDAWEERATSVDHFEFYWFPHTARAMTKVNTRMPSDTARRPQAAVPAWIDDELMPNGLYQLTCAVGRVAPPVVPGINRLVERLYAKRELTDHSHAVFTSPRRVRFREMEYALPMAAVPAALREVRELIEGRGWRVTFPVEVRVAAPDENWMSTAYGRETGYIAVHRYVREDPTEYFRAVEAIMRAHDGRPHWGKMHYRDAESLRRTYPRFDEFLAVRDELDPDRRFTNPYLARVLGV
jgi:FAD-linked oxidoreductase